MGARPPEKVDEYMNEYIQTVRRSPIETHIILPMRYALNWSPETEWVKRMASHLPEETHPSVIGEEWADDTSFNAVLEDWLFPLLSVASLILHL